MYGEVSVAKSNVKHKDPGFIDLGGEADVGTDLEPGLSMGPGRVIPLRARTRNTQNRRSDTALLHSCACQTLLPFPRQPCRPNGFKLERQRNPEACFPLISNQSEQELQERNGRFFLFIFSFTTLSMKELFPSYKEVRSLVLDYCGVSVVAYLSRKSRAETGIWILYREDKARSTS